MKKILSFVSNSGFDLNIFIQKPEFETNDKKYLHIFWIYDRN